MVTKTENRKERASHLRWVPIAEMRVSPKAQRKYQKSHAERYAHGRPPLKEHSPRRHEKVPHSVLPGETR